jgi:hypothetical protein
MSGLGKRTAVVTRDLSTRVDLVEETLKQLTGALVDMRQEMKAERKEESKEIAKAFESLRSDLGTRARPFPFKEVAATAVATMTIIGACISVLNWWYDARSAVQTAEVAALTRAIDPGEMAVMKYRLAQIEQMTKSSFVPK